MANDGDKEKSWRRELILLIAGAVIGLSSSLMTTYMQGLVQRQQLTYEKKLQLIRDYSAAYNEYAEKLQQDLAEIRIELEAHKLQYDNGKFPSDVELIALDSKITEYNKTYATLSTAIRTNNIMVYAIFGVEPVDIETDPFRLNWVSTRMGELRRRVNVTKSEKNKITLSSEIMDVAIKATKELEGRAHDHVNDTNKKLVAMAKKLVP